MCIIWFGQFNENEMWMTHMGCNICETKPGLLETLHVPEFSPPVAKVIALTGILTGITPIPVLNMISWSIWFPAINGDALELNVVAMVAKWFLDFPNRNKGPFIMCNLIGVNCLLNNGLFICHFGPKSSMMNHVPIFCNCVNWEVHAIVHAQ